MSALLVLFPFWQIRLYGDAIEQLDDLRASACGRWFWSMARKRIESWVYWLIVDAIAIWLYTVKDVRFVALPHVLPTLITARGLLSWMAFAIGRRRTSGGPTATRDGSTAPAP